MYQNKKVDKTSVLTTIILMKKKCRQTQFYAAMYYLLYIEHTTVELLTVILWES